MRLLGFEVISISTDAEETADEGASLDGGTTSAYPVGFSLPVAAPNEHDCPPYIEEW